MTADPTTIDAATIRLSVDGTDVELAAGVSVLEAVEAAGISLPHLCKDADGPALGACRTCLVKVEGGRGMPASCYTPAEDGMVVDTQSADVVAVRSSDQIALGYLMFLEIGREPKEVLLHLGPALDGRPRLLYLAEQ